MSIAASGSLTVFTGINRRKEPNILRICSTTSTQDCLVEDTMQEARRIEDL